MTTETSVATVHGLRVSVVRKPIKNLHLAVYPPDGRVRLAIPTGVSDTAARAAVAGRLPWIRRQRARFEQQARESARDMVNGESHWFEGRRFRLHVTEATGRSTVVISHHRTIELRCLPGSSSRERAAILDRWYRARLREVVPTLLGRWAAVIGVDTPDWRIKRMKTKWGSCSKTQPRIWLNSELAKKPRRCLEYVVVHELLHLDIREHGSEFQRRLDEVLPHWRMTRAELGALPLGHERWPD
jgi:predicted metal-dependent hydrolase